MPKRKPSRDLLFDSKYTYDISDIEGRALPELEVTLDYLGWDEGRRHYFEGRIKILDAGDVFLSNLPAALKKMKAEELEIEATNKREATRNAKQWANDIIAEFLASGLFSIATLDASGIGEGVYEYEPVLRVEKARIYKK